MSTSRLDDKVAWYENDGSLTPSWTARVVTLSADGARAVVAGDVSSKPLMFSLGPAATVRDIQRLNARAPAPESRLPTLKSRSLHLYKLAATKPETGPARLVLSCANLHCQTSPPTLVAISFSWK